MFIVNSITAVLFTWTVIIFLGSDLTIRLGKRRKRKRKEEKEEDVLGGDDNNEGFKGSKTMRLWYHVKLQMTVSLLILEELQNTIA